jgi:hypothetical protein
MSAKAAVRPAVAADREAREQIRFLGVRPT